MIIAQKPRVIITSLKKGISTTRSETEVSTGFLISIQRKKTNSRKAMLQMNVNFERKFNKRIPLNYNYNAGQTIICTRIYRATWIISLFSRAFKTSDLVNNAGRNFFSDKSLSWSLACLLPGCEEFP